MTGAPYPIVLTRLNEIQCVVVGGGAVAERKVAALLDCGGRVTVISPGLTERLQSWAGAGHLAHLCRQYQAGDLAGATLVFAATDDIEVNAAVAREATNAGVLVNVADDGDSG